MDYTYSFEFKRHTIEDALVDIMDSLTRFPVLVLIKYEPEEGDIYIKNKYNVWQLIEYTEDMECIKIRFMSKGKLLLLSNAKRDVLTFLKS